MEGLALNTQDLIDLAHRVANEEDLFELATELLRAGIQRKVTSPVESPV